MQGRALPCFSFFALDSTNNEAKRLIKSGEIKDKAVVAARAQYGGRGRYDRRFYSPADKGAYFSYVRRIEDEGDHSIAGAVCALAVSDAVKELTGAACTVKWPNDVKLNGKKLCGILPENVAGEGSRYLIIGAGVNVLEGKEELLNLPFECASVLSETGRILEISDVIKEVVFNLDIMLDEAMENKPAFWERYAHCLETIGKNIRFGEDLSRRGRCVGVDEACNLIIIENGSRVKLNWGEIASAE